MKLLRTALLGMLAYSCLLSLAQAQAPTPPNAQRAWPEGYITGQVTSINGPEAGVWGIAETNELNTPYQDCRHRSRRSLHTAAIA